MKSVSPLNDQSALVRFETARRDAGARYETSQPWVAVVQYRFAGEPMSVEDRYLNPLGFQVTAYRRDAEALPEAEPRSEQPSDPAEIDLASSAPPTEFAP